MEKPWKDKEYLEDLLNKDYPLDKIARQLGCSVGTIQYWIKKLGAMKELKKIEMMEQATAEQIDEQIDKAGGVGQWAQQKIKERYAKHEYLAELYMKAGELEKASREMDRGDDLIKEIAPSRSKIDLEKPVRGPTSKDHKVLIELNKLIDAVKQDANFEGGETVVENAWNNRPELSVQSDSDEVEGAISEESLADE